MKNAELFEQTDKIYEILIAVSTGKDYEDPVTVYEFNVARESLMRNKSTNELLPEFVKTYRDLAAFWGFIKNEVKGYSDRRQYLGKAFSPLFEFVEKNKLVSQSDEIIANSAEVNGDYIRDIWDKALLRRSEDPEGAITLSRTLLEATCKRILDNQKILYEDDASLNQLYKITARFLNLAPSQHFEQQFKQILGGAESVVSGLGSLRNKISDSHAINVVHARPSSRHATLCVNLAGAMSEFLFATYESRLDDAEI